MCSRAGEGRTLDSVPPPESGVEVRRFVLLLHVRRKMIEHFWTPLFRVLMFLPDLSERVSLDDPRQINVLLCA